MITCIALGIGVAVAFLVHKPDRVFKAVSAHPGWLLALVTVLFGAAVFPSMGQKEIIAGMFAGLITATVGYLSRDWYKLQILATRLEVAKWKSYIK